MKNNEQNSLICISPQTPGDYISKNHKTPPRRLIFPKNGLFNRNYLFNKAAGSEGLILYTQQKKEEYEKGTNLEIHQSEMLQVQKRADHIRKASNRSEMSSVQ